MNKPSSQFWKRLVAPVKELFSPETLETTAESSKAVLELGKTLEEQGTKLELLKPLVEQSDSLLDVLCSPVAQVVGAGLPFVSIAIALLKFYRDKTHTEPTLEDCVVLISQAAYLESFAEIIAEHQQLSASWNSQQHSDEALKKALKELDDFELDADAAKRAIAVIEGIGIKGGVLILIHEAQRFIHEAQRFINGVLILIHEAQRFIHEAQRLINGVLILINEVQRLINEVLILAHVPQPFYPTPQSPPLGKGRGGFASAKPGWGDSGLIGN